MLIYNRTNIAINFDKTNQHSPKRDFTLNKGANICIVTEKTLYLY